MSKVNSRSQNTSTEAGEEPGTPMTWLRPGLEGPWAASVGGHGR